jgi:RNA polymerase sigma factor (TIGR02999 family)
VPETGLARLLYAANAGDAQARNQLFTLLYGDLRRMAKRHLRASTPMTLSPTTLLHETFMNISQRESLAFTDRGQFMSYAARAMRGLIIDYLRRRNATKRGSAFEITSLPTDVPQAAHLDPSQIRIEQLNDALESLETIDARLAECVDLKFFCGFSFDEIATIRNVSQRTVRRDWDKARLLLSTLMTDQEGSCLSGL